MSKKSKGKKSRYKVGEKIVLRNDYKMFEESEVIIVEDEYKYGSKYEINVYSPEKNIRGKIPSDWLTRE